MFEMTKTKYVVSGGIAFSEKKDLQVLKKFAAEGWIVKRYKRMGYELENRSPELVDYSIDIRNLAYEDEDKDEYFAMFEFAGWEHVCSRYDTHLFKAPVGTTPIYSDTSSKADKLLRMRKSVVPAVYFAALLTLVSYIVMVFAEGTFGEIAKWSFNVFIVLLFPCVLMYIALTYRSMRLQ